MISPVSGTSALNSSTPTLQVSAGTKEPQAAKAVQVNISKLAQKLAADGDTQAQEVKESGAERSSETTRGKA